jgi:hypothetical protein|tara:strand:- start:1111 stop:1884 length:774 start_codon:yes stop_codon:yes gene_type:complete
MIGGIGNFKMKKLLLILFIFPAFIYGQDVPLTEKKVSTESMENKERKLKEKADDKVRKENTKRTKKYNRSLAKKRGDPILPKNQIGYIGNIFCCPLGLNFYYFKKNYLFGFYVDYRNDFGVKGVSETPSGYNSDYDNNNWIQQQETILSEAGHFTSHTAYNVINIGLANYLFGNQNYALIGYIGAGAAINKVVTYDLYESRPYVSADDYNYLSSSVNVPYLNFNFGILRQTDALISWQVGFDSAVPGINFGIGFTWD